MNADLLNLLSGRSAGHITRLARPSVSLSCSLCAVRRAPLQLENTNV